MWAFPVWVLTVALVVLGVVWFENVHERLWQCFHVDLESYQDCQNQCQNHQSLQNLHWGWPVLDCVSTKAAGDVVSFIRSYKTRPRKDKALDVRYAEGDSINLTYGRLEEAMRGGG